MSYPFNLICSLVIWGFEPSSLYSQQFLPSNLVSMDHKAITKYSTPSTRHSGWTTKCFNTDIQFFVDVRSCVHDYTCAILGTNALKVYTEASVRSPCSGLYTCAHRTYVSNNLINAISIIIDSKRFRCRLGVADLLMQYLFMHSLQLPPI